MRGSHVPSQPATARDMEARPRDARRLMRPGHPSARCPQRPPRAPRHKSRCVAQTTMGQSFDNTQMERMRAAQAAGVRSTRVTIATPRPACGQRRHTLLSRLNHWSTPSPPSLAGNLPPMVGSQRVIDEVGGRQEHMSAPARGRLQPLSFVGAAASPPSPAWGGAPAATERPSH